MMRCAILDDYQQVALGLGSWDRLADVECTVFPDHLAEPAAVAERLAPFDIVVAMRERTPFNRALMERLPQLKLLVTTGMRNASIDLAAAKDCGILVCGTDGSSHGTPEHTWALILGAARHIALEADGLRRNGPWQQTLGLELHGRTLGVLGLGRIGSRVAAVANAFGMKVMAWSPNLTAARATEAGAALAPSLHDLMAAADIITIHLVLGARSRGLVDAAALARMKPTALLVNTSRGPIVDEAALIEALSARRIAGAALDVYATEPLPADHPFRHLPNVLATPHLGYVTEEAYRVFYRQACEDVAAWLVGAPVRVIAG